MNGQQDQVNFYNAVYAFEKSPVDINVCAKLEKECIRYGMYREAFQLGMWMGQLQLSAEKEREIPRRVLNFALLIIFTNLLGGGLLFISSVGLATRIVGLASFALLIIGNVCIICKLYEAILRAGK